MISRFKASWSANTLDFQEADRVFIKRRPLFTIGDRAKELKLGILGDIGLDPQDNALVVLGVA
jgi:hypothetical protein